MKPIRRVQFVVNDNNKSKRLANSFANELQKQGFAIVEANPDLMVAVGGDGCFLRMIHQNHFSSSCLYVGLHAGTLGFLQELSFEEISTFIQQLIKGTYYEYPLDIQKTTVYTKNGDVYEYLSLNEVVIRKDNLKALKANVYINHHLLEFFAGDGLLISTSVGSTAYNMSFGGALVDSSLQTMQITPIAPLMNRHYHNLQNSFLIPDWKKVLITVDCEDLLLTLDGSQECVRDVTQIEVEIQKERLACINYQSIDTTTKIREKLIKG